MKIYAVIDTNVFVASFLTKHADSATAVVVRKVLSGEITPLFSDPIMEEYIEVLSRPRFHFNQALVRDLLTVISERGVSVDPQKITEDFGDPDDVMFYEVVMDKRNEGAYLVTGNTKHFPIKPFIVTPNELLKIIEEM